MPSPAEFAPYVGTGYFERTEADRRRFFGRDREIEELVGLVTSHNVVLVYAASGAGKTSLLNAGVIPKLEEEGLEVLRRARVGVALPPGIALDGSVNPYVLNLLSSLSPEAPAAALVGRTLVDHLRGLPQPEGAGGRVLVIDQAEELFTFTPVPDWQRHQQELFVELREALRDAPDLRVVIVTREDYLARFDDLARLLPGGLRVRFHLEPLGREAARRAVEGPLAATGRRFGDGVADQLVRDLSAVKLVVGTGPAREAPGPYIEPVQLQIVCDALWRRLPDDVEVITAEHLQRYGDIEETLERFYEETIDACTRETGCDRERLARWFGEKLITPADTRDQVFRGPTETEGLPNTAVKLLEDRRLIHADERASGCWYELAHDRLVRPVRAVNERWKAEFDRDRAKRQRRRARIRWGAAALLALVFLGGVAGPLVLSRARERARERALTVDRVEALRERCSARTPECDAETVRVFDSVTDYYWRQGRTEEIASLLKGAAALIPSTYGMPAPGSTPAGHDASEPGLLQIAYHPDRRVDEWRMRYEWSQMAQELAWRWGLPVLPRIDLASDPGVSPSSVRVAAQPADCAEPAKRATASSLVQLPVKEGEALISEADIRKDPKLSRFFDEHSRRDRWRKYTALELGGPWWFVPAWTLPVWRVGGHPAVSPEAILAVVVANEVTNRPELVLGCEALKLVLQQAAEEAPVSLDEAVAARTLEGLRRDLIALVRTHRLRPRYLPTLLDALANHPDVATAEAAALAARELKGQGGGGAPLHGPWRTAVSPDVTKLAPEGHYKEVASAFPYLDPRIRVELGPAVQRVMLDGELVREEILRRLSELRGDVYRRYGVVAPGVKFFRADTEGLRIELLNQDARNPEAQPIAVAPQEVVERLFQELEVRYRDHRAWWLTPDALAASLDDLRPRERGWLEQRYSVTDLKRLARAVVDGEAQDGAATLRDTPWLLRSLAFWIHARDPKDVTQLARALRDTQGARLRGAEAARRGHGDPATQHVRRGLAALDAGQPAEAEGHFAAAIGAGRDAAITAFLDLYPALSSLAPGRRSQHLAAACTLPALDETSWTVPDASVVHEVSDLLSGGGALTPAERRRLELCLLGAVAVSEGRPLEVQQRASALARRAAGEPAETWSRDEAFFLARHWLSSHRRQATPRTDELAAIRKLLARSLADLTGEAVVEVWSELRASLGTRPWRWTRDLIAEVAHDLPTGWPSMRLEMANWLTELGEADAQQALEIADAIDRGATEQERWARGWVRAGALRQLGQYGAPVQRAQRLRAAAAAFQELARTARVPGQVGPSFVALVDVHLMQGDVERARRAIRDGIAQSQQPELFDGQRFFIDLGEGNARGAGAIAAEMVRRAPGELSTLFVDAIFALLTRRADYEDAARRFVFHSVKEPHPYTDYVRLMLAWALSRDGRGADAKQLLDERLREIQPETWGERLRQRDTMVWREMLVAFSAGELPGARIFEPLRNEAAFRASGLSETELSLEGLRCEAYFYAALRDHVTGDPATRDARFRHELRRVIGLQEYGYHEHRMARFLLGGPRAEGQGG